MDRAGAATHSRRSGLLLAGLLVAVVAAYAPLLAPPPHVSAPPAPSLLGLLVTTVTPAPAPATPGRPADGASLAPGSPSRPGSPDASPPGGWVALAASRALPLGLHLVNALLLFALVRRPRAPRGVAVGVAVAWAMLPRLVEAVAADGGLRALLAANGVLIAILLHRRGGRLGAVAGAAVLLVATAAADVAFAGIVAVACLEPRSRAAPSSAAWRWIPLGLAAAFAVLVRWLVVARDAVAPALLPPVASAGVLLEALGSYAAMIADPLHPAARIGVVGTASLALRALGAATAVGVVVGVGILSRHRRQLDERVRWGLGLLVAGVALGLPWAPASETVLAADRLLYLPLLGAAGALAPALEVLVERRRWAPVAAAVGGAVLWVATAQRAGTWHDPDRFWIETCHSSRPGDPVACLVAARVFVAARLGDLAAPLADTALAAEVAPRTYRSDLLEVAAAARIQRGDYDGARPLLSELATRRRGLAGPLVVLTRLELARLDLAAAWARLAELRERFPGDPELPTLTAELVAAPADLDRIRHPVAMADPERARAFVHVGRIPDAVAEWGRILDAPALPDGVPREALAAVVQEAPPEIALEARLDYLRHVGNVPDRELDALLVARRDQTERLRRLAAW